MNDAELDGLRSELAKHKKIAIIWSIEDVTAECPDLTEEQCWEVLQRVERDQDASTGVSWDTIGTVARRLFPAAAGSHLCGEP